MPTYHHNYILNLRTALSTQGPVISVIPRIGQWKHNLLLTMEYRGIDCKEELLSGEKILVGRPIHHFKRTSHTLPNDASISKQLPKMPAKSAIKLQNLPLTSKYRAEQFSNDFYASGDMFFCQFCQHTVDWKRVDTCCLKLMWKTRKNYTLWNSNKSKWKKQTLGKNRTEYWKKKKENRFCRALGTWFPHDSHTTPMRWSLENEELLENSAQQYIK